MGKIWQNLDKTLLFIVCMIVTMSLLTIGSATHINQDGLALYDFIEKQTAFFLLNMVVVLISFRFDYRSLKHWERPMYAGNLLLLLAVMFVGTSALGAQRWIEIGPITIQPSEFSKIIMIICTASMLTRRINKLETYRSLLPVALYVGVPFVLVLKQPDLGTSLVFLALASGMVFFSNVNLKIILRLIGIGLPILPCMWFFLKEYQKDRIMVFFNPDIDPFGAGYHVIQSKIAVGSGLFWGKGLFNGSQSQLDFLPENHTDFIFSVVGEELGFIGCMFLLFLYMALLYRTVMIARTAKDPFGMLLAVGIASMWLFQILVNIGMTCGIMPVTGIPLPFMSYGVSALTTNMLAVAILMNIYARRKAMMF